MKMTMHIDEALLDRVIETYGFASKTEAVESSLREMDRKARLKKLGETGLGMKKGEIAAGIDPDYDLMALRVAEMPSGYGKKKRSGR